MSKSLIVSGAALPAIALPGPDALIEQWHADLDLRVRGQEMSENTANTYKAGLRKFREWMHSVKESQMTADAMRRWKADLLEDDYKAGSVNLWLAGVKTFTKWAHKSGYIPIDPGADVDGAKRRGANRRHSRQAFDDGEMRMLLNYAKTMPSRERCYLMLRAYCGVRDIELHRADLKDLSTIGGKRVLYKQMKGHTEADDFTVIAHPDAIDALLAWLQERGPAPGPLFTSRDHRNPGGRWSQSSARRMILEVRKATGLNVAEKTSHSIRHSAATSALKRGKSIREVQTMLGHASVDTTMIYAHEIDRTQNAAEEAIDYGG